MPSRYRAFDGDHQWVVPGPRRHRAAQAKIQHIHAIGHGIVNRFQKYVGRRALAAIREHFVIPQIGARRDARDAAVVTGIRHPGGHHGHPGSMAQHIFSGR